jgi:hypothetical protein
MESLTTGKYKQTEQYTELPVPIFQTDDEAQLEFLNLYFSTVTYTAPTLVSADDSKAVVSITLTGKDMGAIVQAIFTEIMQQAAQNPEGFNMEAAAADLNQKITDAVNAPDAPVKTVDVQLNLMLLEKDGKKQWRILNDDAIEYGLYLQEPQDDYTDYDYNYNQEENQLTLLKRSKEAATYMGSDEVAELCSFAINGEILHMQCLPEDRIKLEAEYLNKKLTIGYDVYGSAEPTEPPAEATPEGTMPEAELHYVLVEIE